MTRRRAADGRRRRTAAPALTCRAEVTPGRRGGCRRLIDAGASTPEELRAWPPGSASTASARTSCGASEVRPALKKAKKAPFRLGDLRRARRRADDLQRRSFSLVVVRRCSSSSSLAGRAVLVVWVLVPLVASSATRTGRAGGRVDGRRAAADRRGRPRLRARYPRAVTRGRTAKVLTQHWDGTALQRRPDQLIVEEPLEVHLDGHLVGTTMRTPGHDFELAVGLVHGDGLLAGAPVLTCRYCATAARSRAASTW